MSWLMQSPDFTSTEHTRPVLDGEIQIAKMLFYSCYAYVKGNIFLDLAIMYTTVRILCSLKLTKLNWQSFGKSTFKIK